ncbi:nucleoside kinase [Clostridium oryzae]|uniref:Threonine--tRNA ligase 1 n=1 Tax=Clostridium oryzae TaxID=1450648 RepID=A0A1V4IJL5_9CLOT|nr:nucleoside kinase [Clostridium oryzae]OPJ60113.1 threonine--tRNA ligase 1 [Clostridium oryzae]
MNDLNIDLFDRGLIKVKSGTKVIDVLKQIKIREDLPLILGKLNENYLELADTIEEEGTLEPIYVSDTFGMKAYVRTLQFILIKAVYDLFPEAKVTIEHSLSKGIFGEIHKEPELDCEDILKIKKRMKEIIDADIPINKTSVTKDEAIAVFKGYGMEDKIRLIKHVKFNTLKLYELDGRYDYFYGLMAASTGIGKVFDVIYYNPGFLLQFPSEKDYTIVEPFQENKKLARIFYETEKWGDILGVSDVGALNDKVENDDIINIIRVSEALHEKKIANIADMINDRKEVKIVLIAGPSSSGKTTFSKRLGIQLRVNGIMPVPISLDDYFLDREKTPKDENGEYDFESIYALDLELFNSQLNQLLQGKEVELPTFDFRLGKRVWEGKKLSLPDNGIIVVEGIHGLNDILTSTIPVENKFKIYISALTQLNLDNHNRISTTDVRIIRRIVRDFLSRGYGGETTLKMRESIKRGEEKNIFVYQEEADVMFNSTLVYELCVLKKYAMEELSKISKDSPVYYDAVKLRSFLSFFKEVDRDIVPENSILREFIGGSCFYKY